MPEFPTDMLFIDIETTGLDPTTEIVLEVGLVLVTNEFVVVDETSQVIKCEPEITESVSTYVRDMHTKSGLWQDCIDNGLYIEDAEKRLLQWLRDHNYEAQQSPWCGSSVSFDRSFIEPDMPTLAKEFHYRQIDVSTVKELCRRFNPRVFDHLPEPDIKPHRAVPDIMQSIAELQHYADNFFFVAIDEETPA